MHNIVLEAIDKDSSFLAGIVDLKEGACYFSRWIDRQ